MQTIRIFISSPGDVIEERDKARRVIDGLQRYYTAATLVPVLWEDLALPATVSFQESIDFLLHQRPIDIAVFILWSRLGSPLGAALTRPDGSLYGSGTEREFELMLAAFDHSGKRRPLILAYARDDEEGFRKQFMACPGARFEEFIAQRKLAESFIRRQFYDENGRNLRAIQSYREPVSFAQRLHTHLRHALDEVLGLDAAPRWLEEPYRGLEAFDVTHATIFHGRDEETCDLLQRLRDQEQAGCAFAVIVGASGSGKSSLARAGVAAALTQHSYDDGVREWRAVAFVPAIGSGDLVGRLSRVLADQLPELRTSATALDDIGEGLVTDAGLTVKLTIGPAFVRAAEKAGGAVRVLLVLDQMEELWTDRRITDQDRAQFLTAIEALARSGHIAVIATLRSDFYPHGQSVPAFLRLKGERGHLDLLPPGAAALQRLITEPARLAGLRFERDERTSRTLDEVILQAAARDPSALPLLQYALSELYQQRDTATRTLTFAAYETLGGVEGALGRRAAAMFVDLPEDARAALPEILPLLVTVDVAGEQAPVRRRAPLADLTATPARRVLTERLIAARFITTDRDGDSAIAGLAHEALLRRWEQIATWVTANREQLRLRARVEQNQQRWQQQNRDASLLLPQGLPLEEGRQLLTSTGNLLLPESIEYIRASIAHHQAEEARKRRGRRAVMAMMSLLTILALVGGAVAWAKRREASTAQRLAEKRADEVSKARDELTERGYDNSIAIAERELTQNNDIGKASALLTECPERLRGWEWHYLMRLRDGAPAPITEHESGLWGGEFSPDGTVFATCSIDGTLKIWDAVTRERRQNIQADYMPGMSQLLTLLGYSHIPITCLAFSPDGKQIATGSFAPAMDFSRTNHMSQEPPGLVRIWDVKSGAKIQEFTNQKGLVLALTFNRDGSRIASSSINPDFTFVVWDVKTGAVIKRVRGHTSHVHRLRYSPDGRLLATSETDGIVKLWDASTFAEVLSFQAHSAPAVGISFSPDGSRFATAGEDGLVRVWETATAKMVLEMKGHTGSALDVRYSPDGTRIASAGFDKTVRLWDAITGKEKITLRGHEELVWDVAYSPDGQKLLSVSFDKTARIWDASPRVESVRPGEFTVAGHSQRVNCIALSSDGRHLASGSWDTTVRIWDARNGTPEAVLAGHTASVWGVAISHDGRRLASASWDHTVKIWDLQTRKELLTFREHTAPVHAVAFSPDGTRAASGGFDGQLKIWNSTTGKLLANGDGFVFPIVAVVFSPDGKKIATGGTDRSLKLWDAETGEPLLTLKAHLGAIHSLAYSPDGTRVATASWDHTVRIWDVASADKSPEEREVFVLTGHTDRVNGVAFSADGTRLATASEDKTVRLWDTHTGKEIAPAHHHRGLVWAVLFDEADGAKKLISASWSESAWLQAWNIN